MGANKKLVGGAILAAVAVMAYALFASTLARRPLQPTMSEQQEQWPQAAEPLLEPWQQSARDSKNLRLDRSGGKRYGKASFYANFFAGRTMADGKPMNPQADNAASRTLPLGTTAMVTNLKTGQSAVVTIQDRGPYVHGRIVDLSPSTAQKIGITRREGIAKVAVTPLAVPMPDGRIKLGAAARDPQLASNLRGDRATGASW
jgi:rare lipoprotein A